MNFGNKIGQHQKPENNRLSYLYNLLSQEEIEDFIHVVPAGETPLWKHWDEFVSKSLFLGKSPLTLKGTRDTLKYIIRQTGIVSIEEMNRAGVLDNHLFHLLTERKFSLNTRKSYIKNLNTYFIWLYRNHYIQKNNVALIERGRERQKEITPLRRNEIDGIVAHIATRNHSCSLERARNVLAIDLLRFSGIRPCELLDLTTDAIYREKGCWVLAVKGRKQHNRLRCYECPKFIVESFKRYMALRAEYGRWETPLFVSMSNKEGWTVSGLQNFFKKISKEIGFPGECLWFPTLCRNDNEWEKGVARDDMSRFLGHTRFTTTDLYIERHCRLTINAGRAMEAICAA